MGGRQIEMRKGKKIRRTKEMPFATLFIPRFIKIKKKEVASLMSTNHCLGLVTWNSHCLKGDTPATDLDLKDEPLLGTNCLQPLKWLQI